MYLHNDKELFEEVVYVTENEIILPLHTIKCFLNKFNTF